MHMLAIGKNGVADTENGAPDFGGPNGQSINPGQSWTSPPCNTPGTYYKELARKPDLQSGDEWPNGMLYMNTCS